MNVHSRPGDAERAQSQGNIIYAGLLPQLRKQGCKPGQLVAINIDTGEYVVAATRRELMTSYEQKFGHATGWVRRIEF